MSMLLIILLCNLFFSGVILTNNKEYICTGLEWERKYVRCRTYED